MSAERDAALAALRNEVEAGWTLEVTNSALASDDGLRDVVEVLDDVNGYGPGLVVVRRTGRRKAETMTWPGPTQKFAVEGRTLQYYDPSPYVEGEVPLAEFRFSPPGQGSDR